MYETNESIYTIYESIILDYKHLVSIRNDLSLCNNLEKNTLNILLLCFGYFSVEEKLNYRDYLVRIPNEEIKKLFKDIYQKLLFKNLDSIENIQNAFRERNIDEISCILEKLFSETIMYSYGNNVKKESYQVIVHGLLYALQNQYNVEYSIDTDEDKVNIALIPLDNNQVGYIFEFQKSTSDNLDKEAQLVFDQIDNKKCDFFLNDGKMIELIKIGLAYNKERAKLVINKFKK